MCDYFDHYMLSFIDNFSDVKSISKQDLVAKINSEYSSLWLRRSFSINSALNEFLNRGFIEKENEEYLLTQNGLAQREELKTICGV